MPIYEYRCKECSGVVEALQKIADAPLVHCQICKKDTLEKCISTSGMRLSGNGYYETDEKPQFKQRHVSRKETETSGCGTSSCE